jgi:hypothetical protein
MNILQPNGPLNQLSSLWFVCVALVTDVLLIRLFLCLAYIFVLAGALICPCLHACDTIHFLSQPKT